MADERTLFGALLADLKSISSVAFTEFEWSPRPTTDYGTAQIDFAANALNADDLTTEQAYEGSVDVFLHKPDRAKLKAVTDVLTAHCGATWRMNSQQHENETGLFHYEYVFQLEGE